ncbi:hypothetical protein OSB04_023276 [Centaurea solstitialis]|uniref:Uncharacterized protein n=1 Tax=Centaurea solstitialis TaxID=347529 RepID=A0AA38SIU6_9ASTR|nr:hypothetical protein OSB04_023276 [Centaurea solstitialis]
MSFIFTTAWDAIIAAISDDMTRPKRLLHKLVLSACVYEVWHERIQRIFTTGKRPIEQIIGHVLYIIRLREAWKNRVKTATFLHGGLRWYFRVGFVFGVAAGKNSWPELVGSKGEYAVTKIEEENSQVNAIVVSEGTPIPLDFRCDRVWVIVDCHGTVVQTPTIG